MLKKVGADFSSEKAKTKETVLHLLLKNYQKVGLRCLYNNTYCMYEHIYINTYVCRTYLLAIIGSYSVMKDKVRGDVKNVTGLVDTYHKWWKGFYGSTTALVKKDTTFFFLDSEAFKTCKGKVQF